MLPTQQFAHNLERLGRDARHHGKPIDLAPRFEPARSHWLRGYMGGGSLNVQENVCLVQLASGKVVVCKSLDEAERVMDCEQGRGGRRRYEAA